MMRFFILALLASALASPAAHASFQIERTLEIPGDAWAMVPGSDDLFIASQGQRLQTISLQSGQEASGFDIGADFEFVGWIPGTSTFLAKINEGDQYQVWNYREGKLAFQIPAPDEYGWSNESVYVHPDRHIFLMMGNQIRDFAADSGALLATHAVPNPCKQWLAPFRISRDLKRLFMECRQLSEFDLASGRTIVDYWNRSARYWFSPDEEWILASWSFEGHGVLSGFRAGISDEWMRRPGSDAEDFYLDDLAFVPSSQTGRSIAVSVDGLEILELENRGRDTWQRTPFAAAQSHTAFPRTISYSQDEQRAFVIRSGSVTVLKLEPH